MYMENLLKNFTCKNTHNLQKQTKDSSNKKQCKNKQKHKQFFSFPKQKTKNQKQKPKTERQTHKISLKKRKSHWLYNTNYLYLN